MDNSFSQLIL